MIESRHAATLAASFILAVALAACEDEPAPAAAPAPAAPVKEKTAEKPAEAEEAEEVAESKWTYSPVGKRDPFRSYLSEIAVRPKDSGKKKTSSTEEFELSQYRLKGLVFGTSQPRAMVEDPKGKGHTLRVGSHLGKRGGRVTRISNSGFTVVEEYRDPVSGDRVRVPIKISLPKANLELIEK